MDRKYYIEVPKDKPANERYEYNQQTEDDVYTLEMNWDEFSILDHTGLFDIINTECDLYMGLYEEDYLKYPKIEQGIEVIDNLIAENAGNKQAVEWLEKVREYFVKANEAKTQVGFIF